MNAIDYSNAIDKAESLKQKVMIRAHLLLKYSGFRSEWFGDFALCLKEAWRIERENTTHTPINITPEAYNNFYKHTSYFGD